MSESYEVVGHAADGTPVPVQVGLTTSPAIDGDVTLMLRGEDRTGLAMALLTYEEAANLAAGLAAVLADAAANEHERRGR
jgi:hypothetical protein